MKIFPFHGYERVDAKRYDLNVLDSDISESLSEEQLIILQLYHEDPITGVPTSDPSQYLRDADPYVARVAQDIIFKSHPSSSVPSFDDADFALDMMRKEGEDTSSYVSRLQSVILNSKPSPISSDV